MYTAIVCWYFHTLYWKNISEPRGDRVITESQCMSLSVLYLYKSVALFWFHNSTGLATCFYCKSEEPCIWHIKKLSQMHGFLWRNMIGSAVHKNHNVPCIFTKLSPLNQFCSIMVAFPGHILESWKGIEMKLCTYMVVNEKKCSRHEPYSCVTLLELSLLRFFIKGGFLCHVLVYKWCWIISSAFYRQSAFT